MTTQQPDQTDSSQKMADLLAMPGAEGLELETPRMDDLAQASDLG